MYKKNEEDKLYTSFYDLSVNKVDVLMNKTHLAIYETYREICRSRNKNPLYRNLKNRNLAIDEVAIAISSLITKLLISYKKIDNIDSRIDFARKSGITILSNSILEYINFNNEHKLLKCANEIREYLNYMNL